ncbi:hypothetical protein BH18ACT9_BH18ACT9_08360 [soil metagenome]
MSRWPPKGSSPVYIHVAVQSVTTTPDGATKVRAPHPHSHVVGDLFGDVDTLEHAAYQPRAQQPGQL